MSAVSLLGVKGIHLTHRHPECITSNTMCVSTESTYLYKHVHTFQPLTIKAASGIWLTLDNGQQILDATSGAGVSAIGHGNARVKKAIADQLNQVAYCHPGFYQTECAQKLANFLVNSTRGEMARALLTGSGIY